MGILEREALVARAAALGDQLAVSVETAVTGHPHVAAAGLARGFYADGEGTGPIRDSICLGPTFTITAAELKRGLALLREAVDAIMVARRRGSREGPTKHAPSLLPLV